MLTAYSASKFAIRGLTQAAGKLLLPGSSMWMDVLKSSTCLAKELAEYKITVNCYAPGAITTGVGPCGALPFLLHIPRCSRFDTRNQRC